MLLLKLAVNLAWALPRFCLSAVVIVLPVTPGACRYLRSPVCWETPVSNGAGVLPLPPYTSFVVNNPSVLYPQNVPTGRPTLTITGETCPVGATGWKNWLGPRLNILLRLVAYIRFDFQVKSWDCTFM